MIELIQRFIQRQETIADLESLGQRIKNDLDRHEDFRPYADEIRQMWLDRKAAIQ